MNLKALVLGMVLLTGSTAGYTAIGQESDNLQLLGSDGVVRVQMETRQGAIRDVRIGAGRRSLIVDFESVDAGSLDALVKDWAKHHDLVVSARIQSYGGIVQLVVDFNKPVSVLDETLVALGDDRTRMEIVLSDEPAAQGRDVSADQPAPELHEITIARKGDMVEVSLAGNVSLVAEVSFRDNPPAFFIDLPGVSADAIEKKLDELGRGGFPELVESAVVAKAGKSLNRLQLNLSRSADLVDSSGVLRQENSILRMQLVADQSVSLPVGQTQLKDMSLERNRGRLEFVLEGTQGADVKAYALAQPPRLMLDFLGWEPAQMLDALSRFNEQGNTSIAAVRYGESRLGSARVELEMVSGVQLTDTTIRLQEEGDQQNVVVALDAPGLSQVLAGILVGSGGHLSGLDMRYSPAHDFSAEPKMIIKPLTLENSEQWAIIEPTPGQSFNLLSLYAKALDYDAKYLAAKADYRAASEAVPQARSGYLPVASFDYTASRNHQDVQEAANASFPTGTSNFNSRTWALTITQPIVKVPALMRMRQANVSVEQAKVNLLAAEQDLIMRVAEEYLNMLAAEDGLELAQAERESMSKQLELARTSLRSGLGNITELHDAEGRYALAQTKEITALNEQDVARLKLKEIIGEDVGDLSGFKRDFAALPPQPAHVSPWVQAALEQNLALQSRNMATEIAKLEISRQRAGHLPTIDLVGKVDRNDTGGSLYGSGQLVDNAQLMLELNMPLSSGGMTSSLVREATARWEQSEHLKEDELRRTESLARASFIGVLTSAESLAALRKMVNAQESSLQGRLDGFKAGLYDIVDVLDGYRLYYAARRDYLKTRYTYLVNRLRLKQAVGTLSRSDLESIAAMLEQ